MSIITNKKGNSGYIVAPWNYMSTFSPERRNKEWHTTIQISIRPVTIHSCGKKIMRVIENDNNDELSGREYRPDQPIYKTYEDAIEAAEIEYKRILVKSALYHEGYKKSNLDLAKYSWFSDEVKKHEKIAGDLRSGKYPIQTFDYQYWKEAIQAASYDN